MNTQIAAELRGIARTLRQRRRLRLLLRALWIALLVWSGGLLLGLFGVVIPPTLLLALALGTLVIMALYAWLSHPSITRLAHGLEAHYELQQQLSTALEVSQHATPTPIEDRLLHETDTLLQRMRRYFAGQPPVPWREVETFVAIALLAIGLTIATGPLLPDAAAPVALPTLPTPVAPTETAQNQPTEQPVNEEEPPPELSPEAQQAAAAIADALRDNGATTSAADALDRGDTEGAARELRELADQADQLSDEARSDIAQGLRDAAEQLRGDQPELADELEQQADALEAGGAEAEQALEDLARTVEQLGQQGQQAAEQPGDTGQPQQGDQAGAGQQGQQEGQQGAGNQPGAGSGNQLGGEQRGAQSNGAEAQGEELPLPQASNPGGPTTEATGPKGPTVELEAGGAGEANPGGNNSGGTIDAAPDPNTIPSEYRDVVEDYFTPQP